MATYDEIEKAKRARAARIATWPQDSKALLKKIANKIAAELKCPADKICFSSESGNAVPISGEPEVEHTDTQAATILSFPNLQKSVVLILELHNDGSVFVGSRDGNAPPDMGGGMRVSYDAKSDEGLTNLSKAIGRFLNF